MAGLACLMTGEGCATVTGAGAGAGAEGRGGAEGDGAFDIDGGAAIDFIGIRIDEAETDGFGTLIGRDGIARGDALRE